MKSILALLAAVTITVVACWPMMECGFLADDFVFANQFHQLSQEEPGVWPAIRAAFVHTWSKDYEVFRPLTLLTLQLDWVLFGADGRRHHLQTLVLWLLIALVFSDLAVRVTGRRDPWFRALAFALMGCCPSGVEALGWLVGRGCILRSLFSLLAIRSLVVHPQRPWLSTLFLVPALCAYEQAVTLPFILILTDFFLVPREKTGLVRTGLVLLRRHAPTLVVLGLYLAVRGALFGRVGSAYLSEGYMSWVREPGKLLAMIERGGTSLFRMIAPISQAQVTRVLGDSAALWTTLQLLFVLPPAWLLLRALPRSASPASGGAKGWRRLLPCGVDGEGAAPYARVLGLVALWMVLAIIMVLPIHVVSPNLLQGRWLILSTSSWFLLLACAASRIEAGGGREARVVIAALIVLHAAAMRLDLQSWVRATFQAEVAVEEIAALEPGTRVAIFGVNRDDESTRTKVEITETDGIYGLSFGLFLATRRPFVDHAGVWLTMLRGGEVARLADTLDGLGKGAARPALARYRVAADGFARLRVVAPGGAIEPLPRLTPRHRTQIPRTPFPRFIVRGVLPDEPVDGVRVALVDSDGLLLEARQPLATVGWKTGKGRYRFEVEGRHFDPPMPAGVLANHPATSLVWWAELLKGDRCIARAPYAVLPLGP